ncbi:Os03g0200301 [Oryza sativa Japonica Group]|uniref:Os03g0200301 protein n=1 Tax=Oryza sativa subsp. japonica TaxID=39947 RepID=A0A0P0VU99_ORYSJ|nr:Os03g0200301 [Oryza sativa Japonica Group]
MEEFASSGDAAGTFLVAKRHEASPLRARVPQCTHRHRYQLQLQPGGPETRPRSPRVCCWSIRRLDRACKAATRDEQQSSDREELAEAGEALLPELSSSRASTKFEQCLTLGSSCV